MIRNIFLISISFIFVNLAFANAPKSPTEALYSISENWSFDPVTGGEALTIAGIFDISTSLRLSLVDNKTIISFTQAGKTREYSLVSCDKIIDTSAKKVYQLEIKDLTSGGVHDIIVKQIGDQTIWLGLSSRISSDVFQSQDEILEQTSTP